MEILPQKKNETALPAIQEAKKETKLDFQDEITKLIPTAGTIQMTDAQKEILYAPVKEEDVEIRPDGLIYLPWMEYVSRLKGAFNMECAIIPQGMPNVKGDFILWPFWLIIQGKIAGFAVGEQQYYANNATMTYGDALEGAKSNALMRLCKGIGISLELWKPSFIRNWKQKYAESYPAVWPDGKPKMKDGKQKTEWRKKGHPLNGTVETTLEQTDSEQINPLNAGPAVEEEQKQITPEQSALYLTEVIKHLDEYKNIHELRNGYRKHFHEWQSNLLAEDLVKITEYKDGLKAKFEGGK